MADSPPILLFSQANQGSELARPFGLGCKGRNYLFLVGGRQARSSSGLGRCPLKAEITGSNPVRATGSLASFFRFP
jgi:hypothetical protein